MSDPKNEAQPEETLVPATGGLSQDEEEEFTPFDELNAEFQPSQIKKVLADDGLPTQVAPEAGRSDIPPLSTETLVCMGDFSEFVLRNSDGEITERFKPEEVEQKHDGTWVIKSHHPHSRWTVEPIRPPCRHYVRQMTQLPENPERQLILRLCSARRTVEGAFMSVSNLAMWACTMREPRHLESEKQLDDFDTKKVEEGRNRQYDSIFGKVE